MVMRAISMRCEFRIVVYFLHSVVGRYSQRYEATFEDYCADICRTCFRPVCFCLHSDFNLGYINSLYSVLSIEQSRLAQW